MTWPRRRIIRSPFRQRHEDAGSLMILAGIILTLGFIITSLTLAQVSTLEREAAADRPSPLIQEWRFLHERLATNLNVSISEETSIATFKDSTLQRISATFRNVQAEKGYDTVIRLANDTFAKSEHSELVVGGNYDAYTMAGTLVSTSPQDTDDDGLIWNDPCPISGPPSGCIVGVYLYIKLSDGSASVEETVLFRVNYA